MFAGLMIDALRNLVNVPFTTAATIFCLHSLDQLIRGRIYTGNILIYDQIRARLRVRSAVEFMLH